MVVVEEIGVSTASGLGQGGFRHDGIPFQQGLVRKQGRQDPRPHFSQEVVRPPEGFPVGELHLGKVSGLMDSQLGHPGQGQGPVCFGKRV